MTRATKLGVAIALWAIIAAVIAALVWREKEEKRRAEAEEARGREETKFNSAVLRLDPAPATLRGARDILGSDGECEPNRYERGAVCTWTMGERKIRIFALSDRDSAGITAIEAR